MNTQFCYKDAKEIEHLEGLEVDEWTVLQWILKA
jgi:hypothetical protein